MYDAMITGFTDKENTTVLPEIKEKRELAWDRLGKIWPDLKPVMTTNSYRFKTDFSDPMDSWGNWR